MNRLIIEPAVSTLGIDFDPQNGTLTLRGESYPENALNFFAPVLAWLEEYLDGRKPGTTVGVDMDVVYFNSSSSKVLMDIFDLLDAAAIKGVIVSVVWRCHEENEISQECGLEFADELTAVKFEMQTYGDSL